MSSSLMCARGLMKASMPSTHAIPPWSINANSLTRAPRSTQNHNPAVCCMIPQGLGLDMPAGPVQANIPGPPLMVPTVKESHCEMFQKTKEKCCTELTSLSTVTSSASSIHQKALSAYPKCPQYGYYHSQGNCPAHSKECYRCSGQSTLQLHAKEDPRDHSKEAQPSPLEMQAHHPSEDIISLAAGTRLATCPLLQLLAECLPTAAHTAPTILTTDVTRDPPPSTTTRTILR